MKRIIITSILAVLSVTANAGFLTGVVVGRATASGGSSETIKSSGSQSNLITSDQHDVIACNQHGADMCFVPSMLKRINGGGLQHPTVEEFVKAAGYSKIHRRASVINDGIVFIVLEVSR